MLALWWMMLAHSAQSLVILQYHHVSDQTPASTSISPSLFDAHLKVIEAASYTVLDMRQVAAVLRKGESLPDRAVVISFDDGYRSVYRTAYPLLKKRKWPFTVFVNTAAHDQKNPLYMSWDELREISNNGAVIANHSVSHPHLIRASFAANDDSANNLRAREILGAESRIQEKIGKSDRLFAYPYGEYDKKLQKYLKAEGFLAFGQQSGPVAKSSDRQAIPRFPLGGSYGDIDDFKTKLMSLAFPQVRVTAASEKGIQLKDPLLPLNTLKPVLRIVSPIFPHIDVVNCYASGQGKIKSERKGSAVVVVANRPIPVGRSRYNCTAHAGGGRFYWYSHMFIRKQQDGSWPRE